MGEMKQAIKDLDPFKVRELLLAGADVNQMWGADPSTALHHSLLRSRFEEWGEVTVRVLLQFGADPNLPDSRGRMPILDSTTAPMMRLLLEAGAGPNAIFGPEALILSFAKFGDRARVELLTQFGADASVRDAQGNGPEELLARWKPKPVPYRDEAIREASQELSITPEEYLARHRRFLVWGLHHSKFEEPRLQEWAERVAALLGSPHELRKCYETHLSGPELEQALRANSKDIASFEERMARKRLSEKYVAEFGLPEPPFPLSR